MLLARANQPQGAVIPTESKAARSRCLLGGHMVQILVLHAATISILAQPYALDWATADGGGGTSSNATYSLSGTVGQPDAAVIGSARYQVNGGFWSVLMLPSPSETPVLVLQLVSGQLLIAWSPETPGYVLEQTDDLLSQNWIRIPVGTPVTVSLATMAQFYRLHKP